MSLMLLQCSVYCLWWTPSPALEYFFDISGSKTLRAILTISSVVLTLMITTATSAGPGPEIDARLEVPSHQLSITDLQEISLQTTASGSLPSRGMTMAQVEQSYGAPVMRKAAVGNPPITRWEYEGFIVYFEYRHVIHSVTRITR